MAHMLTRWLVYHTHSRTLYRTGVALDQDMRTLIIDRILQEGGNRVTGYIPTAAWLAQLVERRTAVQEVSGSSPRPDNTQGLKITEENVLPLQ